MDPRHDLGLRAEDAAAKALEAAGYRVRARRFRTRLGEIDLVAEDRTGTVVFVEVKARSGSGYGEPLEAVDRRRQSRLARAATLYLQSCGALERACRFDVVSVRVAADGRLAIEHLEDAFRPEAERRGYDRRMR
jgi:putative endonuclease